MTICRLVSNNDSGALTAAIDNQAANCHEQDHTQCIKISKHDILQTSFFAIGSTSHQIWLRPYHITQKAIQFHSTKKLYAR